MDQSDEYRFWGESRDRSHVSGVELRDRPARPDRPRSALTTRRDAVLAARRGTDGTMARRLGALLAIGVLAAPVAYMVRDGGDDGSSLATTGGAADRAAVAVSQPAILVPATTAVIAPIVVTPIMTSVVAAPETTAATVPASAQTVETVATEPPTTAAAAPSTASSSSPAGGSSAHALAAQSAVEVVEAASVKTCAVSYTVQRGDYWIGLAKRGNVKLADLLKVNGATAATALYPGRTICLPAGTVIAPVATTSTAPPTTAKPAPTTTPTTAKPKPTTTTAPPAPPTTAAPTTTTEARPKNTYTRAQVETIIRAVWPDDLEDEAIRIATRESNLIPTVRNSCCFGLFQIYYNANKKSLNSWGIMSPTALYDPQINALAAYAMYLRAGGWGPWSL